MMAIRLDRLPAILIFSDLPCPGQSLASKAFGRFRVPVSAEHECDCIIVAVVGTIQVRPFAFDLHTGLIQFPFVCDRMLLRIETLKQLGAENQGYSSSR